MKRKIGIFGQVALTVALVGGMAFGAREAFAAEASFGCTYSPPTQLGVCETEAQCQFACEGVGGDRGDCRSGCCFCAL